MGTNKELTIYFIYESDGQVTTKIKPMDYEYSTSELYMAFKHLEAVLNKVGFDWSTEGNVNIQL